MKFVWLGLFLIFSKAAFAEIKIWNSETPYVLLISQIQIEKDHILVFEKSPLRRQYKFMLKPINERFNLSAKDFVDLLINHNGHSYNTLIMSFNFEYDDSFGESITVTYLTIDF